MSTIAPEDAAWLFGSDDGEERNGWTRVGDQYNRKGRWHDRYTLVLGDENGNFWGLTYGLAATEYQEHDLPWDDTDAPLPLTRLHQHAVTRFEYRQKPPAE